MQFIGPDIRRLSVSLLFSLLFLLLPGCSKEPTEQQKLADAVFLKAKSALSRGEYREARSLFAQAVELDGELGRKPKVADELRLIGSIMKATAAFDSALVFYNAAIEEYRNLANRDAVREVTLEIASIVRMTGEERKAYGIYVEALRLARVFHDVDGIRDIEWAMLPACRALNEREEEKRILGDLLQDYTGRKDARGLSRVRFAEGVSNYAVGEFDSASGNFQRSFALSESVKDSLMPLTALLWLGMTENAAGDVKGSFQAYGDAIRRSEKVRGAKPIRFELFTRVGNAYLLKRRFGDALRFYRAALPVATNAGGKLAEAYIVLQLGHCELETNHEAAVKNYRSGLELFRSLGYGPGMVYAQLCLGIAARKIGQFNEAYKNLKAALDGLATIAAQRDDTDLYGECELSFLGPRRLPAFEEMIDLLVQAGKFDEAFSYIERRDATLLREDLIAFDPKPSDEALAEALKRYVNERARHIGAERLLEQLLLAGVQQKEQLTSIKTVLEIGNKRIFEMSEGVARLDKAYAPVVAVNAIGLGTIQKALAPGVAFVEFVPTRKALYTFIVTGVRSSVQMAAVGADSCISQSRQFLSLLRRRELRLDTTQFHTTLVDQRLQVLTGQLYSAFIRPIEGELASISKIIVVFSGDLPTIPLHAIRRGMLPGAPFLAEQHLVTYLPTAASLLLTAPALAAVREVVGLGHPGNTDWDVEYELRDIRAFYKDARLFFNQQASLATLQNEKADILHLAVEFRYDSRAPGNSSITVSDGKSVSGVHRLAVGELFSISQFPSVLVSDLAVDHVSIVPAETYIYLARGTGALITNAYTPSRKTKKIFGELFYTALLQGNTTPAAYWKAQLEMAKTPEYSRQCSWGAYFLWGK